MALATFRVSGLCCYDCQNAIKRFLGSLNGIMAVEMVDEELRIHYDGSVLEKEKLKNLVTETVNRLGYKITE